MRLLISMALCTIAVAGCGGKKTPITTDVDYSTLESTPLSEESLTLASAEDLELHIKNGLRLQLKNDANYQDINRSLALESDAAMAEPASGGASSTDGYSETNVIVKGVDEADYAKYDGEHWFVATYPDYSTYISSDTQPGFHIVATDPSTPDAEIISNIKYDDNWGAVNNMYLVQQDDSTTHVATIRNQWGNVHPFLPGRPVLFLDTSIDVAVDMVTADVATDSQTSTPPTAKLIIADNGIINSQVQIQLVDVQTPSQPEKDWTITLDGSLVNSRKVGNMLYLITRYDPWVQSLSYELGDSDIRIKNESTLSAITSPELLPNYQVNDAPKTPLSDRCYLQNNIEKRHGFSTLVNVTAIDLAKQEMVSSQCINSNLEAMSMTPNALYLTSTIYSATTQANKTVIHKFSLTEEGPKYDATGSVSGHFGWRNDPAFRMHEYNDTFRVVTSSWQNGSPEHMLTVLEQNGQTLTTVSTLPNEQNPEPIGKPGEDIYSVRFESDRAYIVTFRQTDPLYAIDLTDPTDPKIAGQLEVPGFASYMHPIGDNLLFTLGQDADENGRTKGMKAQLIDVTGETPRVINTLLFGDQYTHSEALNNSRALSFKRDDDKLRITFPIVLYSAPEGENSTWQYTGLQLLEVTGLPSPNAEPEESAAGESLVARIAAPEYLVELVNAGVIIAESLSNDQRYPGYSINRSIIHDDAVFYAHDNAIWAANWSNPKEAKGPITQNDDIYCTENVVPALSVTIDLGENPESDACSTNVLAYTNDFKEMLEPISDVNNKGTCTFSGAYEQAGDYTIEAELEGYVSQRSYTRVYRDQCHVITEEVSMELTATSDIICTKEMRPSLEVHLNIDEPNTAMSCDASVVVVQDGIHYNLEGFMLEGAEPEIEDPIEGIALAPRPSQGCVFSGPGELAGEMSLEVSLEGYESLAVEGIFIDSDECHVKTQSLDLWLNPLEE